MNKINNLTRCFYIGVLILALGIFTHCDQAEVPVLDKPNPIVPVTILMPDNEPADSVQIRVFKKNNLEEIDLCKPPTGLCLNGKPGCCGIYFIFHDGLTDRMNNRIDLVVEGKLDSLFFRQDFVVGREDDRVFKIAGPDTVHLQSMHD